MSKSSREGLFGITLTELVIILFFIMLLLAIFNIENITKEKEEAVNELIVIKEKSMSDDGNEIILPSVTWDIFVDLLWSESEDKPLNQDLVPVRDFEKKLEEMMFNSAIIEEENKKLLADNEKLNEQLESKGTDPNQIADSQDGTGDCGTGYWITEKCADHCWEIDSTKRNYDYLLDIGVCESSVVVQRSEWLQKNESNFILVEGALEMVNKKYMKASELYKFLDIIKQPGYIKEPKQCFHSVNIIDLDGVSALRWDPIELRVDDRVSGRPLVDPSRKSYQDIKLRFSNNACDISKNQTKNNQIKDNIVKDDFATSNNKTPIPSIKVVKAVMNNTSFNKAFVNACNKKNIGKTNEISLEYSIEIDKSGKANSVELTVNNPDLKGRYLRLNNLGISALKRTSFEPQRVNGVPEKSFLIRKVKYPKNVCST